MGVKKGDGRWHRGDFCDRSQKLGLGGLFSQGPRHLLESLKRYQEPFLATMSDSVSPPFFYVGNSIGPGAQCGRCARHHFAKCESRIVLAVRAGQAGGRRSGVGGSRRHRATYLRQPDTDGPRDLQHEANLPRRSARLPQRASPTVRVCVEAWATLGDNRHGKGRVAARC